MAKKNSKDASNVADVHEERGRDSTTAHEVARQDKSVTREALGNAVEELRSRLERVEHDTTEMEKLVFDELERAKQNAIERDIRFAKLEETVMGAVQVLKDNIGEILNRLGEVQEDLVLCKRAAANGGAGITETRAARVELPRPARFNGVRDAQEVENFLWEMEQYFENLGLTDEGDGYAVVEKATCGDSLRDRPDRHMEEFKRDMKRQFYPENVVYQAQKKLREFRQKDTIRDYVTEFTALLLQIPSTNKDDSVFYFIDGLQPWAKQELQRRGVHSVDEAIAAAESLSDFSIPDRPKSYGRQDGYPARSGGEDRSSRPVTGVTSILDQPVQGGVSAGRTTHRGRGHTQRKRFFTPKGGCHVCKGPDLMKECPKLGSLSAIVKKHGSEEGEDNEPERLGSIQLLNALVTKMGPKQSSKGLMYVEAQINGKKSKAMVDTGASHNFVSEGEARRLGLTWTEGPGAIETVNLEARPLTGFARGVDFRIRAWKGQAKAVPVPSLDAVYILEEGGSCVVPTVSGTVRKTSGTQHITAVRIVDQGIPPSRDVETSKTLSKTVRRADQRSMGELGAKQRTTEVTEPRRRMGRYVEQLKTPTTTRASPKWVGEDVTPKILLRP
ncbi:hypothetical protein EUTSA_v10023044mg [Eutrema salsugineum]|uniref:Retrotransposon gag domain-containing protein n=1 Tax=Eutrema salsugineum TaxID=72664 RepID=V4NVS2_EUTSA|nr:hypothetical protein EUTSA_v10023044mg [Eutrema salsugineum]